MNFVFCEWVLFYTLATKQYTVLFLPNSHVNLEPRVSCASHNSLLSPKSLRFPGTPIFSFTVSISLVTTFLHSVICWLYYNHSFITSGLRKISFSFSINGFTSPRSKARWSNAIVRGITLPATTFPFSSTTGFF